MISGKRDAYMDCLKGIAIVAVIVGHSLNNIIPQGNMLFNLVYSFHMPLLMFVSAYIEESNREKYAMKEWQMLIKRVRSLLIPYVSWNILYDVISGSIWEVNIKDFGLMLLGYNQGGLWFFPVLFGLKVLHFLYWMIKRKMGNRSSYISDICVCGFLEAITVLLALLTKNQYIINMLSYAIPYFFAVIIVDNEVLQKMMVSEWTISFALLIYFFVFQKFSFYDTNWTTQVIRIGLSLCVIIVCLKFREKWSESNYFNKMLCIFGSNSLAIYVLHGFFIDYLSYFSMIESAYIVSVLSVLSAFLIAWICTGIAQIIGISAWWSKVLFGK